MNCNLYICAFNDVPSFADKGITHILSIGGPKEELPDTSKFAAHDFYRFGFFDVTDPVNVHAGESVPNEDDVRAIIKATDDIRFDLQDSDVNILIHCRMGISRSTGAAYILLNRLMGTGQEQACFDIVKKIRPQAVPNWVIVNIADELMGHNGKMIEVVMNYRKSIGIK